MTDQRRNFLYFMLLLDATTFAMQEQKTLTLNAFHLGVKPLIKAEIVMARTSKVYCSFLCSLQLRCTSITYCKNRSCFISLQKGHSTDFETSAEVDCIVYFRPVQLSRNIFIDMKNLFFKEKTKLDLFFN